MAKGKEVFEARQEALRALGKPLARRARSCCELCEQRGLTLNIFEVPPAPDEPELNSCVMLCESCRVAVENPDAFESGEHWRFLAKVVWSELAAVQVLAVRLLQHLSRDQIWAVEALEGLLLDPEVEDWVTKAL